MNSPNISLGSAFGIPVILHWSVPYLLLLIAVVGSAAMALNLALVLVIVLDHEFGHSLVAKRLGVRVSHISILPIGGMAHMSIQPNRSDQELRIALAGPAVNLALALPGVVWLLTGGPSELPDPRTGSTAADFLIWFTGTNMALGLFNLLPAFPMDGGRVLRSILVPRLGELRATELAVRVGRWIAFGMVLLAIFASPDEGGPMFATVLLVIALFIWALGGRELFLARLRHAAAGGAGDPREAFFRMFRGQGFGPGGQGPFGAGQAPPGWPGGEPSEPEYERDPGHDPGHDPRKERDERRSDGDVEIIGGSERPHGGFSQEDIEALERFPGRLPKQDDHDGD